MHHSLDIERADRERSRRYSVADKSITVHIIFCGGHMSSPDCLVSAS